MAAAALAVAAASAAIAVKVDTMSSADVPAALDALRPGISYELSDTPATLSPRDRVAWWARKNKRLIVAAEERWRVDRRAIVGVVMYEALENREPIASMILSRYAGPGKLHYRAERFREGVPVTKEVEDLGYLPRRSVGARKLRLESDTGAIEYVGAIFAAFSDEASRRGYAVACDPAVLATFYTAWTIAEARAMFERAHPSRLQPNAAGTWIEQRQAFLESVVGKPAHSACTARRNPRLAEISSR